jgi:regulatory protein
VKAGEKVPLITGRITAIEPQKRHPDRVSVFVEGQFFVGLPRHLVTQMGLHPGEEIDNQKAQRLLHSGQVEKAKETAYRYLAFRSRSEKEVSDHLSRKGFSPEEIQEVMEHLRHQKWLDDAQFAQSWIRYRQKISPRGPSALRWELRRKGVEETIIEQSLESFGEGEELASAQKLALKKWKQYHQLPLPEAQQKLVRYLQQRGFSREVIRQTLQFLKEHQESTS